MATSPQADLSSSGVLLIQTSKHSVFWIQNGQKASFPVERRMDKRFLSSSHVVDRNHWEGLSTHGRAVCLVLGWPHKAATTATTTTRMSTCRRACLSQGWREKSLNRPHLSDFCLQNIGRHIGLPQRFQLPLDNHHGVTSWLALVTYYVTMFATRSTGKKKGTSRVLNWAKVDGWIRVMASVL